MQAVSEYWTLHSEHRKTSLKRLVPSIAFIIAKWRPTRGELLTRPARSRDLGQGAEESSLGDAGRGGDESSTHSLSWQAGSVKMWWESTKHPDFSWRNFHILRQIRQCHKDWTLSACLAFVILTINNARFINMGHSVSLLHIFKSARSCPVSWRRCSWADEEAAWQQQDWGGAVARRTREIMIISLRRTLSQHSPAPG